MSQKPVSAHISLRYIYAMLAVIGVSATVAIATLYLEHNDEIETHNRIRYFHLESYAEAEQFAREFRTLKDLAEDVLAGETSQRPGVAGIEGIRIGLGGLLYSMRSRLVRLSALQELHYEATADATLERLNDQFDRIERDVLASQVSPETISNFDVLGGTIDQFDRLHRIAADNELRELAGRQSQRPQFILVLAAGLGVSVLAVWYLVYSLRKSLAEQKQAEKDLAAANERLHNIQTLDAVGRLVGGVAHDFNNMLTTILGNVELLQHVSSDSEPLRDGLTEIQTAGQEAANLTWRRYCDERSETRLK